LDPDGLTGLPPVAIVFRFLRLSRAFTQAKLARELLGKNDAGYVSRLESGSERPDPKKVAEIEYAFAKVGEPLDPFEVRMLEAAAIANWN
jgi:transcriptional regulator with XRE-family HTH domain